MSIRIDCNRVEILHCKNLIFDTLYKNILFHIDKKKTKLSDNLEKMLEKMDQETYGFGAISVDIADFIKNKNDLEVFTDLVKESINKYSSEELKNAPQGFQEAVKKLLWNFHKELKEYGEQLEYNEPQNSDH